MPHDPVSDLLSRATEVLEAEFGFLPSFEPASESDFDTEAISRVLEETARRLGDNYPYFTLFMRGRCSSRRIRWRGRPMRWP